MYGCVVCVRVRVCEQNAATLDNCRKQRPRVMAARLDLVLLDAPPVHLLFMFDIINQNWTTVKAETLIRMNQISREKPSSII